MSEGNAQASEPAVQVKPADGEPDLSGTGGRLTTQLFRDDTAAAEAVGNQTTAADEPAAPSESRLEYLRFVNKLDYQTHPINSVTTSRNLRPHYPNFRDITVGPDDYISLSWQLRTGNVFASTATSYIKFSIALSAPFTGNVDQQVLDENFGVNLQTGRSFLDGIKSVRIRHKLGQVIEQVDDVAGMIMSQRVEEQWTSTKQRSVGSLFSWDGPLLAPYGQGRFITENDEPIPVFDTEAKDPQMPTFTDFIVPLSLFTDLFSEYHTLPPDLLSGMRLEIDFVRPNRMFDLNDVGDSLDVTPIIPPNPPPFILKSQAQRLSDWFEVYRKQMRMRMKTVLFLDEHQAASTIRQHQADISAGPGLAFRFQRTDVSTSAVKIEENKDGGDTGTVGLDPDDPYVVWNKNRSDVKVHQSLIVAPLDDWSFDNQFENRPNFILADYYYRTAGYRITRKWILGWNFTLSGEERWPLHSDAVRATTQGSAWNAIYGLPSTADVSDIPNGVGDWYNRVANRQRYDMENLPYNENVQYLTMPLKTHDSLPLAGIAQSPERFTSLSRFAQELSYDEPDVTDPDAPNQSVYETHYNQVLLDLQKVNVVALVQLDSLTILL